MIFVNMSFGQHVIWQLRTFYLSLYRGTESFRNKKTHSKITCMITIFMRCVGDLLMNFIQFGNWHFFLWLQTLQNFLHIWKLAIVHDFVTWLMWSWPKYDKIWKLSFFWWYLRRLLLISRQSWNIFFEILVFGHFQFLGVCLNHLGNIPESGLSLVLD